MLSMLKRYEIQTLVRAEHSFDAVAKLTGVSRRTVARVAGEEPIEHADDGAARKASRVGRPSKAEPFRKLVQKCLADDASLPAAEILRQSRLAGYAGQKSALYALIQELRPTKTVLVTRFEAVPGEFSQHDFGEVIVRYVDGTTERIVFFATRWKFSRWVQVSMVQNQQAETLVRACCEHFAAMGGIPLLAVFDRPKTVALQWRKDGTITKYNPLFSQAMFDMGVGVEVCWPHAPQQKGAVENLVGWVKGSFFKVRRFHDLADVTAQLIAWHHEANVERVSRATGVPPADRVGAERARLRPLKVQPKELAVRHPFRVGPTAMVSLDGSQYSMPPEAAGLPGTAFLFADRVRFEAGCHSVVHPRATGPGQTSQMPEHRAARLAAVSGRRGKQYLKRQDLLSLGEVALTLIGEIVHRRPNDWWREIDALHDLLQSHGDALLCIAMHMAVAAGSFSAESTAAYLVAASAQASGRPSC